MSRKPSRHEHELGAPLTGTCDNWCEGKYKRWEKSKSERIKLQKATKYSLMLETANRFRSTDLVVSEDNFNQVVDELREALKPFANYACDLLDGEVCNCHNCIARKALGVK